MDLPEGQFAAFLVSSKHVYKILSVKFSPLWIDIYLRSFAQGQNKDSFMEMVSILWILLRSHPVKTCVVL